MNNIFKALIAGYGAKKLGGGCFGTILVFVIIWVLLGQCGAAPALTEKDNTLNCESIDKSVSHLTTYGYSRQQ